MDNLHVHPVCGTLKSVFDYNQSGDLMYFGQNLAGREKSSTEWSMKKFEYDDTGNLISVTSAVGIWDNRTSITFK